MPNDSKISILVELDQKSSRRAVKEGQKLHKELAKELSKIGINYKDLSKASQLNIREIRSVSKAAEGMGKGLSKAAQETVRHLSSLGDKLEEARDEAKKLESAYADAADDTSKDTVRKKLEQLQGTISGLNKQINLQKSAQKNVMRDAKKEATVRKQYQNNLIAASKFTPKQAAGGILQGLKQAASGGKHGVGAGLGQAGGAALRGIAGGAARHRVAAGNAAGGLAGANMMASMGKALGMLSAGAASVAAVAKFIAAASDHMADLNKALTKGIPLAGDIGTRTGDYTKSLNDMRKAAIENSATFLELGENSEAALSTVNAFAQEASGSMVTTAAQLKDIGGGSLSRGLGDFAKNAMLYGKALGMESTEVASIMGNMVSEIGVSASDVQTSFGDIVKQAATAGMPVHKFMDVFKDAIPNLDLFTNRMDELTGTMKLLSKTMSPRDVKGFMSTMGRGFDQMDFKQRLKMLFVVGPDEVKKEMGKDIDAASKAIKKDLPDGLKESFDAAMSGKDPVKAMHDVAARAMAAGTGAATVGNMNKLALYKQNASGGDPLKQATAMGNMGLMARMNTLEKYAGKFTGGDLSGLGEVVAKQLGVSEQEYKSLVQLGQSMDTYASQVSTVGRTSSTSINNNLKSILGITEEGVGGDEKLEAAMKKMPPDQAKDMIKQAATMQIVADQSEMDGKTFATIEDINKANLNETLSLSDKIGNILSFLVEKLYFVIDDIRKWIESLFDAIPGWLSGSADGKKTASDLRGWTSQSKGQMTDAGMKSYTDYNNKLASSVSGGATTKDLISQNAGGLDQFFGMSGDKKEEILAAAGIDSHSEAGQYIKSPSKREGTGSKHGQKVEDFLADLSPDQMAKLLSSTQFRAMKDMKPGDKDPGGYLKTSGRSYAGETKGDAERAAKAKTHELDARTAQLYGNPAAAAGQPAAKAADAATQTARAQDDHVDIASDALEAQQQTADSAEATQDLLRKGIKLDNTWTGGKFASTIKDASLAAFRQALLEFAALQAKMDTDPEFKKNMGTQAWNVMQSGKSMQDLSAVQGGEAWNTAMGYDKPGHAAGGSINYDQMARLHSGEFVVPRGGALITQGSGKGGAGGGRTVNVGSMTINITTNNPHEVRQEIDRAFSSGG